MLEQKAVKAYEQFLNMLLLSLIVKPELKAQEVTVEDNTFFACSSWFAKPYFTKKYAINYYCIGHLF